LWFPTGFRLIEKPLTTEGISNSPEDTSFMPRKKFGRNRKNRCRFCTPEGCPRPAYVDYKDVSLLKKLCTNQSKMFSRKRSGNCAAFQRASSDAVKRARFMALIPYVGE
jgi:small subunit ribosomal protein S18